MAKALVNRIQHLLPGLISQHQTGFLPGRQISHNIRKILDIIEILEYEDRPGLVMSLDFYKCFDSINHDSIAKIFHYCGFGSSYISYIMLLFKNTQACVQNNGNISRWFPTKHGSPQGSPASTIIYLLFGQILSDLMHKDPNIKGLQINGQTELMVQFADDTNLFLQYDQDTLDSVVRTLDLFQVYTGLKINYDKTTMYRIGLLC